MNYNAADGREEEEDGEGGKQYWQPNVNTVVLDLKGHPRRLPQCHRLSTLSYSTSPHTRLSV